MGIAKSIVFASALQIRSTVRTLAVVAALTCFSAQAGEGAGTVANLIVRDSDGLVYVQLATPPTSRASCAATTTYWMIQNENSDSGKRLYAVLLAAHVAGRNVIIQGKNTCARWGDGEDILYVLMQ